MSRLQVEFDRLYAPVLADRPNIDGAEGVEAAAAGLLSPANEVRALVLDIGRPVNWELVAPLWRGVQEDLDMPVPAVAISGAQSFQLWFSLAQAIPAAQGHIFLEALRRRYLPEVPASRVEAYPRASGGNTVAWVHAPVVPLLVHPDQWSAFVAPGLAPVFAETPWLDFPPNEDGQADLLRGLTSVSAATWLDAQARLKLDASGKTALPVLPALQAAGGSPVLPVGQAPLTSPGTLSTLGTPAGTPAGTNLMQDPRSFLLQVMNDERVALPLRIEAAKALLPYTAERRTAE